MEEEQVEADGKHIGHFETKDASIATENMVLSAFKQSDPSDSISYETECLESGLLEISSDVRRMIEFMIALGHQPRSREVDRIQRETRPRSVKQSPDPWEKHGRLEDLKAHHRATFLRKKEIQRRRLERRKEQRLLSVTTAVRC